MSLRVRLTRRARFSAAHRYHRPEWDEQRNLQVFGDNVKLHGHNYVVEATVEAPIDPGTGMAGDLGALDAALSDVTSALGYRDLSHGVDGLEGQIPTTENLAVYTWHALIGRTGDARLVRVRLFESADLWAEISEDDA